MRFDRNRISRTTRTAQMLLILVLLLPGWIGSVPSVSAQSYGGIVIGALTCDAPNTSCRSEIGVQFTVTTEDGTFVGSCTVEGDPNDLSHVAACFVTFPFEISIRDRYRRRRHGHTGLCSRREPNLLVAS